MIRRTILLAAAVLALAASAQAAEPPCELEPRARCYGIESVEASLSSTLAGVSPTQAGAHPNLTFSFDLKRDISTPPLSIGEYDAYASTRNVRFELPSGLIGDPNVLGTPQQCTVQQLLTSLEEGGGCLNGAQVGITTVAINNPAGIVREPVYMMQPPGGDVVARLGFVAIIYPTFVDIRVRSESDYGLVAEVNEAPAAARLLRAETTTWGVPADPSHDTERCTPREVFLGCTESESRPPGSLPLPFMTNPTRCGVPLEMRIAAVSWFEPDRFHTALDPFPTITACNRLPFGPSLTVEPTSQKAASPTGADVTIRLPASDGVNVLEPAQMRDIRVQLPEGLAFNPGAADGLAVCSVEQVRFKKREDAHCPDAAKMAGTEFDIPVLERRLRGAIYLREPEPGNLFRIWIVADDLGLHVKLPGQLEVDEATGQITEVTLDIPQAPVREAKLLFKSGFRAPLVNPPTCGEYRTQYEFVPWSGTPPLKSSTPMQITEGCNVGGFAPELEAGTTNPAAGEHSPFLFTLTRSDGEQNPSSLDVTLPKGLAATFKGVPRCEGAAAETGACPPGSRIGRVIAAVGAGPFPLWVPQPGKRDTAVYLSGPYKGAPFSIVAVVPAQAGPFDLGDEVVRSALHVDPRSAQGIVKSDPFPQIIEGIPVRYRTIQVLLDRPDFTLNPTGCLRKSLRASVFSAQGARAELSNPFQVANCANLRFKPSISLKLRGGVKRGAHPAMHAVVTPRPGDANLSDTVVKLPRSAFLDQAHIRTVCTRVQFAADACPPGSAYGHVKAISPLLDETLEGPVYLRSSNNQLPDLVFALRGGPLRIEAVGRIDSFKGGIRASFEEIPDAPLNEVVLDMYGGKKGLIINSRNLCAKPSRALAEMKAQNGRERTLRPLLEARCGKKNKGKKRKRHR